jgi:hypothetical protein
MSGYEAVMQVAAREDAEFWLSITRGFHTYAIYDARQDGIAADEVEFSFEMASPPARLRWLRRSQEEDPASRLIPLLDAGVRARAGESSHHDSRNLFRLSDPDGVGRPLDELQVS